MSLNWNATKVENFAELDTEENWPVTQGIIFTTIGVGMGEITKENYIKFYARQKAMYLLDGHGEPFTLEQIKRHIGLFTNVSLETDTQWRKRVIASQIEQFEYRARQSEVSK